MKAFVLLLFMILAALSLRQMLVAGETTLSEEGDEELESPFPKLYTYICGNSTTPGDIYRFKGLVSCNGDGKTLEISMMACMTYYWEGEGVSENVSGLVAGFCPFIITPNNSLVHFGKYTISGVNVSGPADLNNRVCDVFKRNGTLCGECNDNFSLVMTSYTYRCVNTTEKRCHPRNIAYLLLADLIPLTLFFSFVVMFHISITSGYANTYILYANLVSLQANILGVRGAWNAVLPKNSLASFLLSGFLAFCYSLWSLNIGKPMLPMICLGHQYKQLFYLSVQYVPAFYCLFLVVFTYALIEFHERGIHLCM